ncbi:hypothetical protein DP117_33420 [Brasilonema sp. UFV-L1]|nr:hypothetical protein [Brasilonema sp. UFV-L1]
MMRRSLPSVLGEINKQKLRIRDFIPQYRLAPTFPQNQGCGNRPQEFWGKLTSRNIDFAMYSNISFKMEWH